MCEDLLRANISRRAKIFWQIPEHVRRSASKYQQMYEDLLANISRRAKIFGQISVDVQRSLGQYQQTCKDIWANISRCAKICCGQISEDLRRSKGKYHQTCKNMWANIKRHAKVCGQVLVLVQRSVDQYQMRRKDPRANTCRSAKIYCGQISVDARRFVANISR